MSDSGNEADVTTVPEDRGLRPARRVEDFDERLAALDTAAPFAKVRYQKDLYRVAADLLDLDDGVHLLLERAPLFQRAGVFAGGPWEDPGQLLPELVGVGLRGDGATPTIEALSELRLLALAMGTTESETLDAEGARSFLRSVCAKNLDLMFPHDTEERRKRPKIFSRAEKLLSLVRDNIAVEGLLERVVEEIDLLCAQRPIRTNRIVALVGYATRLPEAREDSEAGRRLDDYVRASGAATERSRRAGNTSEYRRLVRILDRTLLLSEAREFAEALRGTGMSSPYHAVLLRRLVKVDPAALPEALGVSEAGGAEIRRNEELAHRLVRLAIFPHSAEAIDGLVGVAERGLLSRSEVAGGLRRIIELDIRPDAVEALLAEVPDEAGLSATSVLLAGTLSVLGKPLGIGQGNNPTCQAARGLSLWSLHGPGLLLAMIANAARDGFVQTEFEGEPLRSDTLEPGLAASGVDPDLDPVSRLLVPHLDRIYARMMQAAALRGHDAHKWVNPAMYGRWISTGFMSAIDVAGSVRHHHAFVRRFFATHHPEYNDGYELIYPNPVGLMVTDVRGDLLGPHAVSIQRIAESPEGDVRVYFFNPNNDGRQDWGAGTVPTVTGHGEVAGESSLPFEHFVSRLYAFHYDPLEEGDAYAVPEESVDRASKLAARTWGRAFPWIE